MAIESYEKTAQVTPVRKGFFRSAVMAAALISGTGTPAFAQESGDVSAQIDAVTEEIERLEAYDVALVEDSRDDVRRYLRRVQGPLLSVLRRPNREESTARVQFLLDASLRVISNCQYDPNHPGRQALSGEALVPDMRIPWDAPTADVEMLQNTQEDMGRACERTLERTRILHVEERGPVLEELVAVRAELARLRGEAGE